MKKILLFIFNIAAVIFSYSQDTTLSSQDSVCLKKASSMIRQIKNDGPQVKYHLDEDFLVSLFRTTGPDSATKIRILNIGSDKVITLSVVESKLNVLDSAGAPATVVMSTPIELIREQQVAHCSSFSIDLTGFKIANFIKTEILYLKIRLAFDDKETIAKIGRDQ